MKRVIPFFFFLLTVRGAAAQSCDCAGELAFLKNYMETNHPGLNSNNRKNETDYRQAVRRLQAAVEKARPREDCILYLQDYFSLLQDHHIYINTVMPPLKRIATPAQLDSFFQTATYRHAPRKAIDSARLVAGLQQKTGPGIEGLYLDYNGNTVAVIKEGNRDWPYSGIAVNTFRTFVKGTVRFRFKPLPDGRIKVMVLLPDYQRLYSHIVPAQEPLQELGMKRAASGAGSVAAAGADPKPYAFRSLSDSTNYLRVGSFTASLFAELDSFYKSLHSQILGKPYLVIDVRSNGGGSEANYSRLIQYFYADPIYPDEFEYFATPENIQRYREYLALMKADAGRYSARAIENQVYILQQMEAARPFSFFKMNSERPVIRDTAHAWPRKVVILADKGCASSCEAFVYNAGQSKKVVVMGSPTGGFVGYGDAMQHKTPCFGYPFQTTTTKYATLYRYEFKGLPPGIPLKEGTDWIRAAVNHLEQ